MESEENGKPSKNIKSFKGSRPKSRTPTKSAKVAGEEQKSAKELYTERKSNLVTLNNSKKSKIQTKEEDDDQTFKGMVFYIEIYQDGKNTPESAEAVIK